MLMSLMVKLFPSQKRNKVSSSVYCTVKGKTWCSSMQLLSSEMWKVNIFFSVKRIFTLCDQEVI